MAEAGLSGIEWDEAVGALENAGVSAGVVHAMPRKAATDQMAIDERRRGQRSRETRAAIYGPARKLEMDATRVFERGGL